MHGKTTVKITVSILLSNLDRFYGAEFLNFPFLGVLLLILFVWGSSTLRDEILPSMGILCGGISAPAITTPMYRKQDFDCFFFCDLLLVPTWCHEFIAVS